MELVATRRVTYISPYLIAHSLLTPTQNRPSSVHHKQHSIASHPRPLPRQHLSLSHPRHPAASGSLSEAAADKDLIFLYNIRAPLFNPEELRAWRRGQLSSQLHSFIALPPQPVPDRVLTSYSYFVFHSFLSTFVFSFFQLIFVCVLYTASRELLLSLIYQYTLSHPPTLYLFAHARLFTVRCLVWFICCFGF